MSFLLLDDTELRDGAVLQETLAFIDALEALPLLHDENEAASGAGSGSAKEDSIPCPASPSLQSKRRRRKRDAEADVARRRRSKDERLALSREAQVLEQRLALLRGMKTNALSSATCSSESASLSGADSAERAWELRALAEAHESMRAKDLNHKLRDALKRQHALLTAMRDALARAQPKQLLNVEPSFDHRLRLKGLPQRDPSVMQALKCSTHQLYDDLDSVIKPSESSTDIVSSSFAVERNPVCGPYSEHTTMTVVPKGLGVVAALVEDSLLQLSPPCADLEFFVETSPSDGCLGFDKQYTIELHSSGQTVPMNGTGFIRIYRESDRVVILWSEKLVHSIGFRFHKRCWFVVVRSPARPSKQSVARSCYRLEVEKPHNSSATEGSEDICDFIQSKLIARMRGKLETIQFRLLEKSCGEDTGALANCFCPHRATCSRS